MAQNKLYVGNLPYTLSEKQLYEVFEECGAVEVSEIPMDYQGRSKGYGLVLFSREKDAVYARDHMDGIKINGRTVFVKYDSEFYD